MELLHWGLDKFGDEEHRGQEFLLGLKYSAVVGMMVMDVVADINKQALKNSHNLELAINAAHGRADDVLMEVDVMHQWIESAKEDLLGVFQRMRRMEEKVKGLEQWLTDSHTGGRPLFTQGVN